MSFNFTDVFGENIIETESLLAIPKDNFAVTGLSSNNSNESCIIAAVLLRIIAFFEGEIVDNAMDYIADEAGNTVSYQYNFTDYNIKFTGITIANQSVTFNFVISLFKPK